MSELTLTQAFDLALQHHQAGRLAEAEAIYRQILAVEPQQPETLHCLGLIAHQVGQQAAAVELIGQALVLKPDWPAALNNLGYALHHQGQSNEAIAAYERAIALNPHYAIAYNNLGIVLKDQNRLAEAIAACRQALALQPNYAEAQNNLGNALKEQGLLDEAIAAYRQAIALKPDLLEACNNLGNALKDQGQMAEALMAYRQSIVQNAAEPKFYDNLLYALHFQPEIDAAAIALEHRRWEQQHAAPLRALIRPHLNDRAPERRLRIGYVSPDLRDHPVGHFLLPLLEQHDRDKFEIVAYAQVAAPDEMTGRLRAAVDGWRNTVGRTDEQLAEMIRAEQIDILVDLTLHMAHNRLLVFARKPAPIQVSYLAYAGSSGLTTMDYRFSDPYLDPPGGDDSIYSEQTIRLPETYWCYQPPPSSLAPATPRTENETIWFGCLSNFCKVNDALTGVWAKILHAVPHARLLMHAGHGAHRDKVRAFFVQQGIAPRRVEFLERVAHAEYFQTYHTLDITLDTTPYAGGTTTCDSLWMGVPVVTLAGERAVGRSGVSILSNIGLPELIAKTPEEYIAIAVKLTHDRPRLQELHATLRPRMQASPLLDAPRFARNVEAAYRRMWHTWCESGKV